MEIGLKFYLYQILGVFIIWLGMTFFLDKIDGPGKLIYYVVTSWLLFLFVLTGKKFIADRREKQSKK